MYPRQDDVSLFQRYVNDKKLEEKGIPITELRRLEGTDKVMLGVDGTKIIDAITQSVREKEKMAVYTYTTPFTVYDKTTELCKNLGALKNCTPVLVFNGIPFSGDLSEENSREKNHLPSEIASLNGTTSSRLCLMQPMRSLDIQQKSASRFFLEEDVEYQIIKLIRTGFNDTMRAPYLAWAQLSAFCHPKNRHISEVYGCLELLAFPGIDRVITNINSMKGTVDMVRKSRLLELLRISEEDLGSLILIDSRNRIMRTVAPKFSSFDEMCDKIVRIGDLTLGASYAHHQETMHVHDPERGRMLKNTVFRNLGALGCPVLTLVAPYCTLLNQLYELRRQVTPNAMHSLGYPLPTVMYYMFTVGLLSPSLFSALCQRRLVDDWPLVDSVKYREVAEIVLPLRVQTLYQFALPNRMSASGMQWVRCYNTRSSWATRINAPPEIMLDAWNLNDVTVNNPLYMVDVMEFAHLAVSSREITYKTVEETSAAILLQSLDLLGYLTHETRDPGEVQVSEPSLFGRALKLCSVQTLSEYIVLLIELARTQAITPDPLRVSTSDVKTRDIPREIILASRILSIIPLNVNSSWTGPIDTELAAFSMISRMVSRSIRHLLEAMMTMMFYQSRTSVSLHRIRDVEESLPFATPVEFGGGVIIEYILMNERCTLDDVQQNFPECNFLEHDLAALFYFWDLAVCVLNMISESEVLVDVACLAKANERVKEAQRNLNMGTAVRETYY